MPLVSALGRKLLARPFPAKVGSRVLIAYRDDMLAYPQFAAFFRYGRRFAAKGIYFRAIPYSELNPATLPPKLDALFLQSDYRPEPGELEDLLAGIRRQRPRLRIAYFDWFAPSDIRFAERVAPWVDAYVKKSLLRERSAYLIPTRGHTNLSDYYSERWSVENPPIEWAVPPEIIPKLAVGPSFSTAKTLDGLFEGRPPAHGERPIDLHARIATRGTPWYSAMREEAAAAVAASFPDLRVASQGTVGKRLYMQELRSSKLCFSPFGYGEICWRDFEAVAAGAVVIKPDMGHIECDPDIYVPFETYIPVRWDLSDLDDRVREALADLDLRERIARNAFAVVREHLAGDRLLNLVQKLAGVRAQRTPPRIVAQPEGGLVALTRIRVPMPY